MNRRDVLAAGLASVSAALLAPPIARAYPDRAIRLVVPPGSVILFSGDQLHSTVRNETALTRWSIDFRTVDLGDVLARRGAPARDVACTGTSLRDFRRTDDFEPMPAEAVALYDDGSSSEGMAVFAPGGPETVEQAAKPAPVPDSRIVAGE